MQCDAFIYHVLVQFLNVPGPTFKSGGLPPRLMLLHALVLRCKLSHWIHTYN
uniref:Uncharacterized protein n=1 Tax=Arundo donax TaxID=35708 RepID=A0A0A8ZRU0_ARUDO